MLKHFGLAIALCVLVLFIGPLAAQDIPVITQESAPADVAPPDPKQLRAEWWRYFDVGPDQLAQRVAETLSRIEKLIAAAPLNQKDRLKDTLERLRINLQALPKLKAQQDAAQPEAPTFKEAYAVDQILELNRALRDAEKRIRDLDSEVARKTEATRAAQRRVDTQLAAHLALAVGSSERLLSGITIMADRAAVAIAEEQIRLLKAQRVAQEVRVKYITDEKQTALERAVASEEELARLQKDIENAERTLERARDELRAAQAKAVGVVGDSQQEKDQERYRNQAAILAAAKEGLAATRLALARAKHDWAVVHSADVKVDLDELQNRLKESRTIADESAAGLNRWRDGSERELRSLRAADEESAYPGSEDLYRQRLALVEETFTITQRLEDRLADLELISTQINEQITQDRGLLRAWFAAGEGVLGSVWEKTWGWLSGSLFKLGDAPVTPLGLLRVIVILTIAFWLSRLVRHALDRIAARQPGVDKSAFYTVGRLVHYMILTVALLIGLSSIGLDFSNLALVAGALGVGIGFGLQSIVSNFVSGLILLFERSLKVGDYVELDSGITGVVREINVRSTLINTNDNIDILVPNSEFVGGKLINWTLRETNRRLHVPFGVAYGTDKDLVKKAGLEAAGRVSYTLKERRPEVWLVGFGDSSLDFELVVWVDPDAVIRPAAVQAQYLWEIETSLKQHGIEIPFPQRDLHLRSGFDKLRT